MALADSAVRAAKPHAKARNVIDRTIASTGTTDAGSIGTGPC